ncbi:MAG: EAL domain-containing protein [Burkholderiaceae bacterium]|nr:EAL domain-containing protein [Burkholderiaceae bacterium]
MSTPKPTFATSSQISLRAALSEFVPAIAALAATLVLGAAALGGLADWPLAILLAALVWALAAGALALRNRRSSQNLARAREQLRLLEELQGQHGIAENLGAFGTWLFDRASNRLVWSAGAFRLHGIERSAGEPSLRDFATQIHPDDRARWIDSHRRALRTGGEARLEYRYVRANHETVWIRSIARAERDERGAIHRLAGVAQDVTGIRAMQQQLAASEAKFRDLTRMSSDWVWETDAQHQWSYFSDSAEGVLGRWIATLLGRKIWDLPASQFAFEQPDWWAQRTLMDRHAPFEAFEYAVIDPDREVHFVSLSARATFDSGGTFTGYRGVGRNITLEKQQRLLLQLESDITSIIREHHEPERVLGAVITALCAAMGWTGGANLVLNPGARSFAVRERWGFPPFTKMLSQLPLEIPLATDSAEARVWKEARAMWIDDLAEEPQLAQRYQAERIGARAAFLAPIVDESGGALSVLLCLCPASFVDAGFMTQVAEVLSRNLSLYLQRKSAEQRLTHQSLHDALTTLPNRVFLSRQLEQRLVADEAAAVLYIDLDRYKLINDTLGHSVGDQVLIEVAQRLRDSIRPQDVAGRIGGDEFILLLTGLADRDEIERIARRVLAAIEKPFILAGQAHFLSASIGVAVAPEDGRDAALLIKCADSAMYRVKSEGRNDVRFFAGDMSDQRVEQLALASELPLALQRGDVELFYQPILDVAARRVVAFEALLRWLHPTRGLLLPERFLLAAEQSNLSREVGHWVLRRALDDRVALGLDRYDDATVSVNISPRQLAEADFLATLNAMLGERNFPGRLLRLELTESALIEHPERTAQRIADLRRLGVQVIIDNFGTGYASLSYLKNLPVDGLKIDQTFVRDLPVDRGNAAIIQAVTTLAARMGVQAMVEGVETAAELRALRSYECDQMQGTLICEPLPLAQLREFLDSLPQVRKMHLVRDPKSSAA